MMNGLQIWETAGLIQVLSFMSEDADMSLKITWGVSDRTWVSATFNLHSRPAKFVNHPHR